MRRDETVWVERLAVGGKFPVVHRGTTTQDGVAESNASRLAAKRGFIGASLNYRPTSHRVVVEYGSQGCNYGSASQEAG